MKVLTVVTTLALAGCSTPGALMTRSSPNTYQSAQAPRAVTNCITRNQVHAGATVPIVTEAPGGELEVAIRSAGSLDVFLKIAARQGGSAITAYSLPQVNRTRAQIEGDLLRGC